MQCSRRAVPQPPVHSTGIAGIRAGVSASSSFGVFRRVGRGSRQAVPFLPSSFFLCREALGSCSEVDCFRVQFQYWFFIKRMSARFARNSAPPPVIHPADGAANLHSASLKLTDQPLVFRMRTNPKPISLVSNDTGQRSMVAIHSSTPQFADFLEVKRRMPWIISPKPVSLASTALHIFGQSRESAPKSKSLFEKWLCFGCAVERQRGEERGASILDHICKR